MLYICELQPHRPGEVEGKPLPQENILHRGRLFSVVSEGCGEVDVSDFG